MVQCLNTVVDTNAAKQLFHLTCQQDYSLMFPWTVSFCCFVAEALNQSNLIPFEIQLELSCLTVIVS